MLIYKITNRINGKAYIGQASGSFKDRYKGGNWWKHTHSIYLKRSVKKHGLSNFTVDFLSEGVKNIAELNKLEEFYIKEYNTLHPNGFNLNTGGGAGGKMCDSSRDKLALVVSNGKNRTIKNHYTGEIFNFINVTRFCNEKNLCRSGINEVLNYTIKNHKGWILPDTILKVYQIVSPEGKTYDILEGEIKTFSDRFNLCNTQIYNVLIGVYPHHKRWRLPGTSLKNRVYNSIVSPNGELYYIPERGCKKFCREHGLAYGSILHLLLGHQACHLGWKLPD